MSSVFSFSGASAASGAAASPASAVPIPAAPAPAPAAPAPAASTAPQLAAAAAIKPPSSPLLDQVAAAMLAALNQYLPAQGASLPAPSVSLVSVTEQTIGLGQHVGTDRRGSLGLVELKGGRLDTVVRFQVWASVPDAVETVTNDLFQRIMADRAILQNLGFLRIEVATTSSAELISNLSVWRKMADYHVLYEYQYQDTGGAQSLITRIPIHTDPEERNSPQRETTIVTDEMTRWDDQDAPSLIVRGPFTIGRLSTLAFIPGTFPSGSVTLTRTFDGASGPPKDLTLAAFLAAVSGPNPTEHHAQVVFQTLSDFLAALGAAQDTMTLGDWNIDGVLDEYTARALVLAPPIQLAGSRDRLELAYQNATFNQVGVVYLRATRL